MERNLLPKKKKMTKWKREMDSKELAISNKVRLKKLLKLK